METIVKRRAIQETSKPLFPTMADAIITGTSVFDNGYGILSKAIGHKMLRFFVFVSMGIFLLTGCDKRAKDEASSSTDAHAGSTADTASGVITKPKYDYPQESQDAFIDSCTETSGGLRHFCTCLLSHVQNHYSFDDFAALEQRIIAQGPPEEFNNLINEATTQCR